MKKIPYGISDYKNLIEKDCFYIDKTMYIEKLEDVAEVVTYLRPGRFGKTLFTSMLFYYYDVNSKKDFDNLFKDTYVYSHPTKEKNSYYVLKFNFSGIETSNKDKENLVEEFIKKVIKGLEDFNSYYHTNYIINMNENASGLIRNFFTYFNSLQLKEKLYIIIDEYDNFTNAILEGNAIGFKELVGNNGIIKSFYATIKEYRETPGKNLGRFFMTGICPITLNSMTTGFNISTNISTDIRFNSMIGLTHKEVINLLNMVDKSKTKEMYDLMIEYYDGYLFNSDLTSEDRVFNATLVMYFLNSYIGIGTYPKDLVDPNLALNYAKLERIIKINNNPYYKEILDKVLKTNNISGNLVREFNLEERYDYNDVVSMLYYFGYLSIEKQDIMDKVLFRIPNKVNKELYNNYFIKVLKDNNIDIDNNKLRESYLEIVNTGKIENLSKYVEEILKLSSNRIFIKFDKKYIQVIYNTLLYSMRNLKVYTEYETSNGYIDLYIGNNEINKYNILIELKYLPKYSFKERKEKIEEGKKQLIEYSKDSRINNTNIKKYVALFIGSKLEYLEEI